MKLTPTQESALLDLVEYGACQWPHTNRTGLALQRRGLARYYPYSKWSLGGRTYTGQWKPTTDGKRFALTLA